MSLIASGIAKVERTQNGYMEGLATLCAGVFFGDDLRLQLTLDARLQAVAAKALATQIKTWKAQKGVAIVMDVTNGELLVLSEAPYLQGIDEEHEDLMTCPTSTIGMILHVLLFPCKVGRWLARVTL